MKYKFQALGTAGIVILVVYYIFLILAIASVQNIEIEYGDEFDVSFSGAKRNICQESPRFIFKIGDDEPRETTGFTASTILGKDHMECSASAGILGESECNAIQGCVWEEITIGTGWFGYTWFGFTSETIDSCTGKINGDYYNISTAVEGLPSYNRVLKHENTNFQPRYGSVCNHPQVVDDQYTCELFSCIWIPPGISDAELEAILKIEPLSTKMDATRIFRIVTNLMAAQIEFSNVKAINTLLYIIFVYIPFIILMASLMSMTPLINSK